MAREEVVAERRVKKVPVDRHFEVIRGMDKLIQKPGYKIFEVVEIAPMVLMSQGKPDKEYDRFLVIYEGVK